MWQDSTILKKPRHSKTKLENQKVWIDFLPLKDRGDLRRLWWRVASQICKDTLTVFGVLGFGSHHRCKVLCEIDSKILLVVEEVEEFLPNCVLFANRTSNNTPSAQEGLRL